MSRFLKNATFPILIVVVLAFFAQRFLGQSDEKPKPNFGQFLTQVENGQVKSVTINTRDNTLNVTAIDGKTKYETGYPDNYEEELVRDLRKNDVALSVKGKGGSNWLSLLTYILPFILLLGVLDIPDELGAGRWLARDELREVPRQTIVGRLAQGHVPRRGGRRRGRRGAARDQGVPREPQEVPGARRPDPEGRAALRPAGHRQDAAGPRRRRRGRRAVLLDLRLRLRRDVRRRRRLARA